MSIDRRLAGGLLGVALLVGACGGASSSPAASSAATQGAAAPSAAATSAAQGGASQAPADTSGASAPAISLAPGNAADLEAMIPDKVGSITITKTSFDYSSIPWSSLGSLGSGSGNDIQKVLTDNGKTLADVRFAMGVGTNSGATVMPTMVYALQVKGLDASKFVASLDSSYDSATGITVGGKSVKGSVTGGYGTVTYLHNDVAFIALGSEADLNTLVAALP